MIPSYSGWSCAARRFGAASSHVRRRAYDDRLLVRAARARGDEAVTVDHGTIPSGVMSERYAARDAGFDPRSHAEPARPEKYAMNSTRRCRSTNVAIVRTNPRTASRDAPCRASRPRATSRRRARCRRDRRPRRRRTRRRGSTPAPSCPGRREHRTPAGSTRCVVSASSPSTASRSSRPPCRRAAPPRCAPKPCGSRQSRTAARRSGCRAKPRRLRSAGPGTGRSDRARSRAASASSSVQRQKRDRPHRRGDPAQRTAVAVGDEGVVNLALLPGLRREARRVSVHAQDHAGVSCGCTGKDCGESAAARKAHLTVAV